MANTTYSKLINEMNGSVRWKLLEAAIRMKLFDQLSTWSTVEDIAQHLEADKDRTALYLDALTAAGYLEKLAGIYRNSPLSETYLTNGKSTYSGDMVLSLGNRRLAGLDNILALLQKTGTQPPHLREEQIWKQAMQDLIPYQHTVADEAVRLVRALPGSNSFTSLLDLGGGPGVLGRAIAKALPHISVTLFDLPGVVELVRADETSLRYVAGDYSADEFGSGYDVIWASRSLYYARNIQGLLTKITSSLKTGGFFLSIHEGLYNERTAPEEVIINRVAVALSGSDVSFSRGELETAATEAGLEIIGVHSVIALGGEADVILAMKP